jgi:hypothetical protein
MSIRPNVDLVSFNANTIYESTQYDFQMNYYHLILCDKIYNGISLLNHLLDIDSPYLNFNRKSYIENLNLKFHSHITHKYQLHSTLLHIDTKRILNKISISY